jgi:hypothetical protein
MSEGLSIPRGQYEAELQLSPTAYPEPWFIMASNCEDIISMDVKITLLNPGGWWTRQFSVDEQGLLPMFACYIAVYSIGTLAYAYLRGSRLLKQVISPLEWLFIAALALEFLSVFLQTTHGVRYAADGVGLLALQGLAEIADAASTCAVMAALLCVAHGLGGARDAQELPRGWVVNAGAFGAGFLSLFAFDRLGRTMDQRYCYDSDVGAVIVVYRVAAFVYFAIALSRTNARAAAAAAAADAAGGAAWAGAAQRRGWLWWGATGWFLGLPAAYFAAQLLPVWDQMRLVVAAAAALHAAGLAAFAAALAAAPPAADGGAQRLLGGGGPGAGAWPHVGAVATPYDEI